MNQLNGMRVISVFCLFLVASLGFFSTSAKLAPVEVQLSVPRFEDAPCAVPLPESEKNTSRCGYLIVPENRARRSGQTIKLPIIILKSSSAQPAPDPVLRTLGGPGASSLRMVRGRRSSPWLANRDLVIFEQRGTRYAEPRLECPEVNAARLANLKTNPSKEVAIQNEVRAAKRCYDRLKQSGIDLSAYDSVQSAADIEDLRRVLGYRQWNLYGVSYSSRLMLNVMRDYPQGIRSVVLESVLAPQVNYDEVGVDGAKRALDVFFKNCAADAKCTSAHPQLEQDFYELVKRMNSQPIELSVKPSDGTDTLRLKLNGDDLITWLLDYVLSADAEAVLAAPANIAAMVGGDYKALSMYAGDKTGTGYMLGMRFSVWCREEMPFQRQQKISAQARRYPQLQGYEIQPALVAVCSVWKVGRSQPRENQPVHSDIPTLILSAEYDAYTPPVWGRLTAGTLSHSFHYEVPGVGHGPGFSDACARKMIAEFLNNPGKAPDERCLR